MSMWNDIVGAGNVAYGAEDIYGADPLDSFFGAEYPMVYTGAEAAPLAAPAPAAARRALAGDLMARHSAMVVPRTATKAREFAMGFPTTSIAAAATSTITSNPQIPFRARRLIIPSDIAGSLLVTDLKIGNQSMLPNSNPVPARVFSELAVGVDLNLDTAQISQNVSVSVSNTSGAAVTFNAAIIGTVVY